MTKSMLYRLLPMFVLLAMVPLPTYASVVQLNDARPGVYLYPGKALAVLTDSSRRLTAAQAAASADFVPMHPLRDPKAAYWLRFTYTTAHTSAKWYLFLGYKPLTADFFIPRAGGFSVEHSGLDVPYADRPVRYYGAVVFELPPAAAQRTVYVRVTTIEPQLTVAINSEDLLFQVNRQNFAIVLVIDTVLLVLLVNALTFFALSRDRLYLLYALYLLAELLYRTNDIGVAAAVLWPHLGFSMIRIGALLDGIRITCATAFIRAFLHTRRRTPVLDRAIVIIAGIWLAIGIAICAGVAIPSSWLLELAIVYVPVWLVTSFVAWRKGEENAWLLVAGWSLLMLFNAGFGLKQLGLGRGNLLAEILISRGSYLGVAVQMMFLSIALLTEFRKLARTKDEFAQLSATDALTGIANRRVFEDVLQREWSRAARSQRPISLLMLDVDFFKKFNDSNGHRAGDDVLRHVAQTGAAVMRGEDTFCRYGGEEFVAILPDSDEHGAMTLAERLSIAIADLGIAHPDSPHGIVTVSIGVATGFPANGMKPHDLYECADRACYSAKQGGRNRCVSFTDEVSEHPRV